ncbi:MAG: protein translocase subunit SecF [Candidatus Hydrothermae bacterium]|nr:protein translocase subunit SecF [Candidatus Hydrothermae bacterium]
MRFFRNPNVDFVGMRRYAFIVSGALIVLSLVTLLVRGGPRYGIDFTGGTLAQVHIDGKIDIGKIRQAVFDAGIKSAEIQNFGSPNDFLIKYKEEVDASDLVKALKQSLGVDIRLDRTEEVGPRIGQELKKKALLALLVGLALMLIYITFRFDFKFGVGSIFALFHDVFITIGIFSLLNKEITIPIVAALLTIIGYSINDSIVVSDRIRENLRKLGKVIVLPKFISTVNRSLNETLSRTVITSLTTLIVLISVLIFGGPVIFDFAFALTVGVIVGTYSSVFVVAALVVEWTQATHKGRR